MPTLYITDLDGTLLNLRSCVTDESARIISELSARGAMITVATARTPATVVPLLAGTVTNPPAIVMTGAAVWDRQRSVYREVHYVPADEVLTIIDACHSHGIDPMVYTLVPGAIIQVYHAGEALNPFEANFINLRSGLPLKHFNVGLRLPHDAVRRVVLMFALGPIDAVRAVADDLRGRVESVVSDNPDYLNPDTGQLEVFGPGVSKAAAVRRLKEQLGADRMVIFGDNLNDLSMLAEADVAVAVANAVPEVIAAADCVIGSNETDAVARYIATDFRLNG